MNVFKKFVSIVVIVLAILLIGFICFKKYNMYLHEPVKASFEKIATLTPTKDIEYDKWLVTITDLEDVKIYKSWYGITIPANDFNKNNLMIVANYEIKDIYYTRKDSKPTTPRMYYANITYKDEFHPNTIFVYRTDKVWLTGKHW